MTRWYRAYEGTVTDAKLGEAALIANCSRSVAIAAWHCILESCASAQAGGAYDTSPRRVAVILGEQPALLERVFVAFTELGMIGDGAVTAWRQRQFESDTSTERSKKHRERRKAAVQQQCNGDATLQQRDATAPDTDTDTDSGKVVRARDLESHLREAAGWQAEPAPMLSVTGEIEALIDAGADLELDVLPVVRAIAPKATSRTTWRYFVKAIARQRDERISAAKIVTPLNTISGVLHETHRAKPSRRTIFDAIHARIDQAERGAVEGGSGEPRDPPQSAA